MGPPRTHRERRAGPSFIFSPFLGQKNYILVPNLLALCSPALRGQVCQTRARHSRRRRPVGDPPSPRWGRIRPRPPNPGWLLSPLPS